MSVYFTKTVPGNAARSRLWGQVTAAVHAIAPGTAQLRFRSEVAAVATLKANTILRVQTL